MKVDFHRTALAEALGLVNTAIAPRTPKAILKCVHLSAAGDALRLSATDLEVGVSYAVAEVEIHEPGQAVLPADRLTAIVRESTDDVLHLAADAEKCMITSSDSNFTIYTQPAAQFPPVPLFEGPPDMEISLDALQAGIEQCLFATARESTRYAINGVLWQAQGKKLTFVATDGRRLARSRVGLKKAAGDKTDRETIVPTKIMALLDRLDGQEKQSAAVRVVDGRLLIGCGKVDLSSNLVEGNFPKYEDIIPADYDKKLTLSTEAVLSAVRRASLLTSEESRGVKIAISPGSMVFSSRTPEAGDAQVTMAAEYKGEPVEISFSPQFLIDALRVMKTPEFTLEIGQSDRPGLLKSGPDFLYVLMPISLG
jgi:DNA polymerase-3 subunit beta